MRHDQGSKGTDQEYRNTIERLRFLQWPNWLSEGISGGIPGHVHCPGVGTMRSSSK